MKTLILAVIVLVALVSVVQAQNFNATYEHLEDMLRVGHHGFICYTGAGWCYLVSPLLLGSYCCCPAVGVCGYVGN